MFEILFDHPEVFWASIQRMAAMSVLAFVSALVVGTVVAAFRISPVPPLRVVASVYTEFFRNMPLAVLMIALYFVLPDLGYLVPSFWTAWLALTLYSGAYAAEIVRSGINTVAPGEAEAGRALGLGFTRVLGHIVVPQAVRTVVPPLTSLFIAHTKNTTVAALISSGEVADFVRRVGSSTAQYFDTALLAAVFFVVLLVPIGALAGQLERKVTIKR